MHKINETEILSFTQSYYPCL